MKKNFYLLAAAALAFGLSSCKSDSGMQTLSYSTVTYNLVTSVSDPDYVVVSGSWYKYAFDFNKNTVALSSEIALGENKNLTLTTDELPFKRGYYNLEGGTYEVTTIDRQTAGVSGDPISNLNCELTTLVYIPPTVSGIQDMTFPQSSYYTQFTIMEYIAGANYYVRTFWPDVTFRGTTTSFYQDRNGLTVSADNKDIMYRVIMDFKNGKATVILYNAKFSDVPLEPVKSNIVLKDLTLKFSTKGYEITGENIIPECYEGGIATPNNSYKFNKFTLTSSGDLVNCNVDFTVAGIYSATFNGAYALRVGKTSQQ